MTAQPVQLPLLAILGGLHRFSVAEYHRLTEIGVLTEDADLELIEGYLVHKMARNPPHDGTMHQTLDLLNASLPAGWKVRIQSAITLADSEPEPDLAVVRKEANNYRTHHPSAAEVGLVVEVSDSTLAGDRADKGRIYARAGIPFYWIVNIPNRQVEVYALPSGPIQDPAFAQQDDYRPGGQIPFILDGSLVASIPVQDIFG